MHLIAFDVLLMVPMLHLLREASLEAAIDSYPDVDGIPQRNIELMNELGSEKMRSILRSCLDESTRKV